MGFCSGGQEASAVVLARAHALKTTKGSASPLRDGRAKERKRLYMSAARRLRSLGESGEFVEKLLDHHFGGGIDEALAHGGDGTSDLGVALV